MSYNGISWRVKCPLHRQKYISCIVVNDSSLSSMIFTFLNPKRHTPEPFISVGDIRDLCNHYSFSKFGTLGQVSTSHSTPLSCQDMNSVAFSFVVVGGFL